MAIGVRPLKYLLGWLIAGTRGGVTRAKIIEALQENPQINWRTLLGWITEQYGTILNFYKRTE
jgi:hypothetical protein